ncbi:TPA: hypothetical protein DF272_01040 [Candidatus Falkowbacteria bacterium]|nr:hypothetical protein [Candidatus Falkowbacteria bacterium]
MSIVTPIVVVVHDRDFSLDGREHKIRCALESYYRHFDLTWVTGSDLSAAAELPPNALVVLDTTCVLPGHFNRDDISFSRLIWRRDGQFDQLRHESRQDLEFTIN